jgi:DNA (cytosine-5)-methyltransferase 1
LLNAADFGLSQNRQRVFIVGVRADDRVDVGAVRLASEADLGTRSVRTGLIHSPRRWLEIVSHGEKFPNWGIASSGRFCAAELASFSDGSPWVSLECVLQGDVPPEFDFTESTVERLKNSTPVKRFVQGVEILSNQGGGARMGYTVFGTGGLAPTLTSAASRHYERYLVGGRYRRLTNVEYARLQGFPDDHCSAASVYDQYALYGNAVPPAMAAWVTKRAISRGISVERIPRGQRQQGLFADA